MNGSSPGAATSPAGTVYSNTVGEDGTPQAIPPSAVDMANQGPIATTTGTVQIGNQTKQTVDVNGTKYVGGDPYGNRDGALPTTGADGKPITYTEWDNNPYTAGVNRGGSRVVIGSDGRDYYTDNHYKKFTQF